jgi:hypothetical protein
MTQQPIKIIWENPTVPQGKKTTYQASLSCLKPFLVNKFLQGNIFINSPLFVLFSSMCEQKVSTYMPSWALLVMTAVCKEVRKKITKLLTRIKQELNNNMSIKTKTKNK